MILGGGNKKKNKLDSNKNWIESSIRQSVAEWKQVMTINKENKNNNIN
jgi:hypothetical protein